MAPHWPTNGRHHFSVNDINCIFDQRKPYENKPYICCRPIDPQATNRRHHSSVEIINCKADQKSVYGSIDIKGIQIFAIQLLLSLDLFQAKISKPRCQNCWGQSIVTSDINFWLCLLICRQHNHRSDDHPELDADAVAHLRVEVPGAESADQVGIPTLPLFRLSLTLIVIISFSCLISNYFSVVRHANNCKGCEELCGLGVPKQLQKKWLKIFYPHALPTWF